MISNNFIILNMSKWIINQCLILSYNIDIISLINSTNKFHQYYSYENNLKHIQINHLQSNQDYQLYIKINSQAGEIIKVLPFRTMNNNNQTIFKRKTSYKIIKITIISIISLILVIIIIICILIKIYRQHIKGSYNEYYFKY